MTILAKHLAVAGITDAAMAEKVGCGRSMISKLRAGKAMPSLHLAAAISREIGVSIDVLFFDVLTDASQATEADPDAAPSSASGSAMEAAE